MPSAWTRGKNFWRSAGTGSAGARPAPISSRWKPRCTSSSNFSCVGVRSSASRSAISARQSPKDLALHLMHYELVFFIGSTGGLNAPRIHSVLNSYLYPQYKSLPM